MPVAIMLFGDFRRVVGERRQGALQDARAGLKLLRRFRLEVAELGVGDEDKGRHDRHGGAADEND